MATSSDDGSDKKKKRRRYRGKKVRPDPSSEASPAVDADAKPATVVLPAEAEPLPYGGISISIEGDDLPSFEDVVSESAETPVVVRDAPKEKESKAAAMARRRKQQRAEQQLRDMIRETIDSAPDAGVREKLQQLAAAMPARDRVIDIEQTIVDATAASKRAAKDKAKAAKAAKANKKDDKPEPKSDEDTPTPPEKPSVPEKKPDPSVPSTTTLLPRSPGGVGAAGGMGGGGGKLPRGLVPHGSTAPKLSSVIVIPSPARPLFPGLYFPVVVKDPKMIKDLLAYAKKDLPYVGVFMTKEEKSSAFMKSKTTIQPVDKLNPSITADVYEEASISADDIHNVGCFSQIYRMSEVEGGGLMLILVGLRRIEVLNTRQAKPYLVVDVKHVDDPSKQSYGSHADGTPKTAAEADAEKDSVKALTLEIMATLREIIRESHIFSEQLTFLINNIEWNNPSSLADVCATVTTIDTALMQEVLATYDLPTRLRLSLGLLKKEKELVRIQQDIHKKVETAMGQNQRKYLLNEQLKSIKKELGLERDDKEELRQKYVKMVEGKTMPEDVAKVWDDEMAKLSHLEPSSMEFNVTRNYLDWLANIPWGVCGTECYDLAQAETILNRDHYGLEDVKDRIIEFVAVSSLRGTAQGRILLLVGPPGVGKTSIGKSIAHALSREFFRFSVGGLHDATEIKGHRRTYVGAMPGKLVQALKKTSVSNPVILIDEIDKLGRGGHGDPSSALLEALDPEQNNSFLDHYLDVPVDLSKVLFVCTANSTDTIPGPLLDRMTVIRISGYVEQEKVHIAKHYLCPTVGERTGITRKQASITSAALTKLIKWYCREAGVRALQRYIEQIYSKVAVELVRGAATPVVVDERSLGGYVGQEVHTEERMYARCPVGVVMGMAWSNQGGSVLYLECVAANNTWTEPKDDVVVDAVSTPADKHDKDDEPGRGERDRNAIIGSTSTGTGNASATSTGGSGQLRLTGQLGEVMKESASIAFTLAKVVLGRLAAEQRAVQGQTPLEGGRLASEGPAPPVTDMSGHELAPTGSLATPCSPIEPAGPSAGLVPPLWTAEPVLRPAVRRSAAQRYAKTDDGHYGIYARFSIAEMVSRAAVSAPAPVPAPPPSVHAPLACAASPSAAQPRTFLRVPQPGFFAAHDLHLHVPQGAVPKDGPSAGVAMMLALLSTALNRPLVADVAMTGEVCLTGRVLPIGGLKEKAIAARRAGVRTLFVPRGNAKDVAELPDFVTEGMTVFLLDHIDQAVRIGFGCPWALNGDQHATAVKVYPEQT